MEANGMTLADYAALEKMGNRHRGAAVTGLALGAVALGVGVIGTIAVGWGVNAASKARSRSAEKLSDAAFARQNDLLTLIAAERNSREGWINRNQPTLAQYVDVQTNPSLNAQVQDIVTAMAAARAEANNTGINSAVGSENFLRVQHYSAPQPCGCPCNGGY